MTKIPTEFKQDFQIARSGATLFVLLHELSHLALKHHHSYHAITPQIAMPIKEKMSIKKAQEHEADLNCANYLIKEAQPLAAYWLNMALNFFIELEQVSGVQSRTHPLAINRVTLGTNNEVPDRVAHLSQIAHTYKQTQKESLQIENQFLQTDRTTLLAIIDEIDNFCRY